MKARRIDCPHCGRAVKGEPDNCPHCSVRLLRGVEWKDPDAKHPSKMTPAQSLDRNTAVIMNYEYPSLQKAVDTLRRERDTAKAHADKFPAGRRKGALSKTTIYIRALAAENPGVKGKRLFALADKSKLLGMTLETFSKRLAEIPKQ